jgi:hypothetical protein
MIRLNPAQVLIVTSIAGILVASALMTAGAIWARLRLRPLEEASRRVDDLARRQQSIEALLARLEAERHQAFSTAAAAAPGSSTSAAESRPPHPQRADRPRPSAVGGPTLITVPSLAATTPEVSSTAAAELGRRFGAIWELADSGQSPDAIARTTGLPVGQVELILGLRRQLAGQAAEHT